MQKTYLCARSSGDTKYLTWLQEQLVHVYHENPNTDFVLTIDNFINYFERREKAPWWLKKILRWYSL